MRILDLFRAGSSTQSIVVWPPWTSNYQIRRPPTLRWPRTRPNTHEVGGDADSRNCTRGVEDSTSQLSPRKSRGNHTPRITSSSAFSHSQGQNRKWPPFLRHVRPTP